MKKHLLSTLAFLAFFFSANAQTDYDFFAVSSSGDTLYYYLDNSTAVVTCPGDIDEDVYWPDGITKPQGALVIDNTVTYNGTTYTVDAIGDFAFYGCDGITSVTIPSSVTTIKEWAFRNCSSLASVDIPASISHIGNLAFSFCTAMDSIVVKSTTPPSVGFNAFRNVPDSCLLVVPCGKLQAYTEAWGTYFARIVEDCGSGVGINDVENSPILVHVTDGCIAIASEDGFAEVSADVYDLSGRRVASLQTAGKTPTLPDGIYLVRIGNQITHKVVVKR